MLIPLAIYLYFTNSDFRRIGELRSIFFSQEMKTTDGILGLTLFAPFFEELLFRLPLAFFAWLRLPLELVLCLAVLMSIWFGLLHGLAFNILFQGFAGLLYSILFLKCGGLQGKPSKALFVTFIAHAINNSVVLLLDLAIR